MAAQCEPEDLNVIHDGHGLKSLRTMTATVGGEYRKVPEETTQPGWLTVVGRKPRNYH
ncbi:hypothetical protein J6590_020466 [Homalodisca vitripennis]|nr:hypothetical protein J6590_020466 [Homalodisca vitripennis]